MQNDDRRETPGSIEGMRYNMGKINIFIRTDSGPRVAFCSVSSTQEVRDLWSLLRSVGVFAENEYTTNIALQAIIDGQEAGFEFIATSE